MLMQTGVTDEFVQYHLTLFLLIVYVTCCEFQCWWAISKATAATVSPDTAVALSETGHVHISILMWGVEYRMV
jgi:hypothetical protein